jgi:soluble lytic murein transglycosylase-like protein
MTERRTEPAGDSDRADLLRKAVRQGETPAGGPSRHPSQAGGTTRRGQPSTLALWEEEQRERSRRRMAAAWNRVRLPVRLSVLSALAFILGLQLSAQPAGARLAGLENELDRTRGTLQARKGELNLVRLELSRLQEIVEYSRVYRIPADLAAAIHDNAVAEGIGPAIAFQLVRVESGFYRRAISPVGAVGLAQLMPPTAYELDPSLQYSDLFDRDTNLRLGFRYLRQMLDRYDGDLRLALLAYNRGPGTVDTHIRRGEDPTNGYDEAVLADLP